VELPTDPYAGRRRTSEGKEVNADDDPLDLTRRWPSQVTHLLPVCQQATTAKRHKHLTTITLLYPSLSCLSSGLVILMRSTWFARLTVRDCMLYMSEIYKKARP